MTKPEGKRGTGRTTELLRQAIDLLQSGAYRHVVYVVPNTHLAEYCARLVQDHIAPCMYSHAAQRITIRTPFGTSANLQFIVDDREYYMTHGYRSPVFRDHAVLERRRRYATDNTRYKEHIHLLHAAGKDPLQERFNQQQMMGRK